MFKNNVWTADQLERPGGDGVRAIACRLRSRRCLSFLLGRFKRWWSGAWQKPHSSPFRHRPRVANVHGLHSIALCATHQRGISHFWCAATRRPRVDSRAFGRLIKFETWSCQLFWRSKGSLASSRSNLPVYCSIRSISPPLHLLKSPLEQISGSWCMMVGKTSPWSIPRNRAKPRKAVSGSSTKSSTKKSRTWCGFRCSNLAQATILSTSEHRCIEAITKLSGTALAPNTFEISGNIWSSFMIRYRGSATKTATLSSRPTDEVCRVTLAGWSSGGSLEMKHECPIGPAIGISISGRPARTSTILCKKREAIGAWKPGIFAALCSTSTISTFFHSASATKASRLDMSCAVNPCGITKYRFPSLDCHVSFMLATAFAETKGGKRCVPTRLWGMPQGSTKTSSSIGPEGHIRDISGPRKESASVEATPPCLSKKTNSVWHSRTCFPVFPR